MEYFPWRVSDHSSLALWLIAQPPTSLSRAPWKRNATWLKLFTSQEQIVTLIDSFFQSPCHYDNNLQKWETFKAYPIGVFIAEIQMVKRNSSALFEQVGDQVRQLELSYVIDPSDSDSAGESWMSAQDSLDCLRSSAAGQMWSCYLKLERFQSTLVTIDQSSLLQSNVKILAKVLALLVNGIISIIIHSD